VTVALWMCVGFSRIFRLQRILVGDIVCIIITNVITKTKRWMNETLWCISTSRAKCVIINKPANDSALGRYVIG